MVLKKTPNQDYKIMDINVENIDNEQAPLLANNTALLPEPAQKNLIEKIISQTFESTSHLANLLPTGTVLAFQFVSPILTNQGQCDPVSRDLTAGFMGLCVLSCFLLSFTDSLKDQEGNVCYGFATIHGLWMIDGSRSLAAEFAVDYRLRFMDFIHGLMSIMVFVAVALFDEHIVNCFYPSPSDEVKGLLTTLPLGLGVICSTLFVVFPTKRHGIGFPITTT